MNLKGEELLTIQHLEFTKLRYAICGESGLGKTSVLKDIQGCLVSPFSSSGTISLPMFGNEKIVPMFIDQNLYIPATATLLEAIILKPTKNLEEHKKNELKAKIIQLFKEFAIDKFAAEGREDAGLIASLDDPKFNADKLSGGQKKKIGIIKAIIEQPKILFADEIFVGLDKYSLYKAQQLLKKYLPDTQIVIVDHYAENNNYESFYDQCIKFSHDGCTEVLINDVEPPSIIGNLSEELS